MVRFVTLLLLLVPGVAVAQAAPIDSGIVVRMHRTGAATIRGRLFTSFQPGNTTVVYCRYPAAPCLNAAATESLALADIMHLDVAQGSHWKRGALIGGVVGAALGGLLIAFANGLCETSSCRSDARLGALVPLGMGVGLGAAFGSTSLVWKPRW